MRSSMQRAGWVYGIAVLFSLGPAGSAQGLQFDLVGNERIGDILLGQLPTGYSTPPAGVDYDAIGSPEPHPGEVLVTGTIPELVYYVNGAGAPVTETFSPDLTFTLEAAFLGSTVTPNGPDFDVTLTFGTTVDGVYDLIVSDPDPDDNGVVDTPAVEILRADLIGGNFFGGDVPPLVATATVTPGDPQPTFNTTAFFVADPSSTYASLFDGFSVGLELGISSGFLPDFNTIGPTLFSTGDLISHTAQASGQVFGIGSSGFVPTPEPGTASLLALGMLGLTGLRRRERR